jgi:hypothetical protein
MGFFPAWGLPQANSDDELEEYTSLAKKYQMLTDHEHLNNEIKQFTTNVDGAFKLSENNRNMKELDSSNEISLLESIMYEVEDATILGRPAYTRKIRPKSSPPPKLPLASWEEFGKLPIVLNSTQDFESVSPLNNFSWSERDILAAQLIKARESNDKNAAETSNYIKVLENYINRKPIEIDPFLSTNSSDAINSQSLKEKIASLSTDIEKLHVRHEEEQNELEREFSKLNTRNDVAETHRLNLENLHLKSENLRLLERIVELPKINDRNGMNVNAKAKPLKSCLKPIKRDKRKGNDVVQSDYYHKAENERKLSMMKYNKNWNAILEENSLHCNSEESKHTRIPKFKVPEPKRSSKNSKGMRMSRV